MRAENRIPLFLIASSVVSIPFSRGLGFLEAPGEKRKYHAAGWRPAGDRAVGPLAALFSGTTADRGGLPAL